MTHFPNAPSPERRKLRLLLVEDDPNDAFLLLHELDRLGYDVACRRVEDRGAMEAAFGHDWDLIISDFRLPRFDGLSALEARNELAADLPFIIVSGTISEEEAVQSIRLGAGDYVTKGGLARLGPAIARALRDRDERRVLKTAEARVLQAQKMQAIGELAGGVAHDFNNLLGVIQGYGELALRSLPARDANRERLEHILAAAASAANLTRQLLAFSRQQPMNLQVLDVAEVVANVEKMLRRLIGEDIQIVIATHGPAGRVRADPTQLEQVLMNLAINARDAMPAGGRLLIETGEADLDAGYAASHPDARPGRHVLLAVSDTGTGMSAETMSRIFEPFFTTKEHGHGTGLGLATVYGIVRQSGGHVAVYSEVGRGTSFKVYLPRVDAPLSEPSLPPPPAASAGNETILVVEDEEALRDVIVDQLAYGGYTVLSGPSVEAALEISASHRGDIHLVITDIVMPGLSGREAARRVRERRPRTKVLYMSGYTSTAASLDGSGALDEPFLQKPFSLETLLRRVREVLERPGPGGP